MKKFLILTSLVISFGLSPAFAQFGPRGGGGVGPNLGGATGKLFGANQTFSSDMEFQTAGPGGADMTMSGKISFDMGKSRFEMNMSETKGLRMPPNAAEQMKSMGMDQIVSIARPDLKQAYVVYPGLNSYAVVATKDAAAGASPDDFKVETADLGKETVDGHDCNKKKVTVTDKDGNKTESTVWTASDLKDFPVKIVTGSDRPVTLMFKNVTFTKPSADLFEPPTGYTKYDNAQTLIQTEMMKKMGGGGMGMPPQH